MKAIKEQMLKGRFSSWSLGRAQAYRLVARHYPKDAKFWREMMRENALWSVRDAKFYISTGLNQWLP